MTPGHPPPSPTSASRPARQQEPGPRRRGRQRWPAASRSRPQASGLGRVLPAGDRRGRRRGPARPGRWRRIRPVRGPVPGRPRAARRARLQRDHRTAVSRAGQRGSRASQAPALAGARPVRDARTRPAYARGGSRAWFHPGGSGRPFLESSMASASSSCTERLEPHAAAPCVTRCRA